MGDSKNLSNSHSRWVKIFIVTILLGLSVTLIQRFSLSRVVRTMPLSTDSEKELHKIIRENMSPIDRLLNMYLYTSVVLNRQAFREAGKKSNSPEYQEYIQEQFYPENYCKLGDQIGDWEISVHSYTYFGLFYKNFLFTCDGVDYSRQDGFGRFFPI